jgi:PAS domain S-box-containing protein
MHDGLLDTTLAQVRSRIDGEVLKSVRVAVAISALGGILLLIALMVIPHQSVTMQESRLGSCIILTVIALIALALARWRGARASVAFFAVGLYALAFGIALYLGTGVGSAGTVIPAAMIAVISFTLGPRIGLWWTRMAIAGVVALLYLELAGHIPGIRGGNIPPAASYAVVNIIVFLVIGSLISRYSTVFWEALRALDGARGHLQAQVDTLERTRAELLDSEQRLSTLLDHAPLAIMIFDQHNGALRYANRHALQAHGVASLEDLADQALFSDGPYHREAMLQAVRETWSSGARDLQWRSRGADGEPMWWALNLNVLSLDGQPHVVAFGHDITARLKAERALIEHRAHLAEQVRERTAEVMQQQRRLETIIEALPVSLTIKDRHGRYQLCNRLFEQATRLTRSQLLGRTAEEVFPAHMAEQIRRDDDALLTGTPGVRYEISRTRRNGEQRDHLVTKVALPGADGQPEAVLTLSVDISDQKALQRELSDAKNEAERLASVKSAFLANMSHEIRTPLHGMLGLTQLGLREDAPPPVRQALTRIQHAGRHLLGVINDILDFSKIDAGKLPIACCAIDPQAVAQDALTMVSQRARDKGLALRFDAGAGLPPAVLGDPLRIRQILINLLSNAIKFTHEGGVVLQLTQEEDQLHFVVEDTGMGLHPEMHERVFSPFEQADGSTSRRFGGTGLGLSISRQLARLMGGDLTLRSQLGQGATFTLTLPLQVTDAPAPSEATQGTRALWPGVAHLQGLRILAADDVDINRDILVGLLNQQGAEVHCVEDGREALLQLKQHGPGYFDIALMDVQMPVMNGLQATELLHMIDADLPVVALTAHALPEERLRCEQAGMVGHLSKPFEADDMLRLVLRYTRRQPEAPSATPSTAPLQATGCAPTTRDEAQAPLIDYDAALRRCGNRADLLRTLLTRFRDEQADCVVRCQDAWSSHAERGRQLAHRLKGTAGNLGMTALAEQAGLLEAAMATADPAAVRRAMTALQGSLDLHLASLSGWLAQQTTPA